MHFEAQDDAAFVITDFVRRYAAVTRAKNILASLRKLKQLHHDLTALVASYQANMRGYRSMLLFNDSVEKLIFKLDDIKHYRNNYVRSKRKSIVKDAQDALRVSDQLLKTMRRKLKVVVKVLRTAVDAKKSHAHDNAARVVQRVIRAIPAVRAAKLDIHRLRMLRHGEQEIAELHAKLVNKVLRLQAQAYATMDTSSDAMVQARAQALLDKTTTEYDGLMQVSWPVVNLEPESKRSKTAKTAT